MSISTVLRQWCPVCVKTTVTVQCPSCQPPVFICKECRSGHLTCATE